MEIVPAVHNGYWIKEGDKILLWAHTKEHAEKKLKEMTEALNEKTNAA